MILDTGPLVAAANRRDPDHEVCRELISRRADLFVVPAPVIAEAGFLIARAGGPPAEVAFLRSLCSAWFLVEGPTTTTCSGPRSSWSDMPISHLVPPMR